MQNILRALRTPAIIVGGIFGVYLFFGAVHYVGLAHAAATAGETLPVVSPSLDSGWGDIATYGPIWGGMYVVLLALQWVFKKNESTHWFAQGKNLAYVIAAVGTGITALEAHFSGTAWSGVAITAVLSLFKLINPTGKAAPAGNAAGGAAVLALLVLGGLAAPEVGCGSGLKGRAVNAGVAALNCEAPELQSLVQELLPLAVQYVTSVISPDGKSVDTASLKKAWSTVKSDQGRCALATAVATLANPEPAKAGQAMAAPLVADRAVLLKAYGEVAAEHGWGTTVTSAGTL